MSHAVLSNEFLQDPPPDSHSNQSHFIILYTMKNKFSDDINNFYNYITHQNNRSHDHHHCWLTIINVGRRNEAIL